MDHEIEHNGDIGTSWIELCEAVRFDE